MPSVSMPAPPIERLVVSVEREQRLDRWDTPWKLTAPGIAEMWFRSPADIFDAFFGQYPQLKLASESEMLLRGCLAEMGVTHGRDPRVRTAEEVAALPVGAQLSYYGFGETFTAVKQKDGTWRSEVGTVDPTSLRTTLVKWV